MKTAEQQLKIKKTNALGEVFSLKNKNIEYFDNYLPPEHGSFVHATIESFFQSYTAKIQKSTDEASVAALKEPNKNKIKAFKSSLINHFHLRAKLVLFQIIFIPIAIILLLPLGLIKGASGIHMGMLAFFILAVFIFTRKALKKAVYKNIPLESLQVFCRNYFNTAQ